MKVVPMAVAQGEPLSERHVNGWIKRLITPSTVKMEVGNKERERLANDRYRDFILG